MAVYKCRVCGYIFDEEKEGKSIRDIDVCPRCKQPDERFELVEEDKHKRERDSSFTIKIKGNIGDRIKMKDNNCGYCVGGEPLAKFGIKICDLEVSQLILFKEQSHPGRCIVAYKDHVSEIVDISDEERNAFFGDVNRAAKAIHKAFNPDKVNYGAYGDTGCHLHMHLVPKYKDQYEWGGVFEMNPQKVFLSDEEYEEIIEKIKGCLE